MNQVLKDKIKRNPFVALCEYASQNNWCWKITCTTCGHSAFRVAFSKLVHGEHPDDDSFWPNGKENHSLLKEIDNYNDFDRRSIDKDVHLNLAKIVAEAKISDLQKVAKFPDWLGYIGLVIHYCYSDEPSKTLAESLIPQFMELLRDDKNIFEYLDKIQLISVYDLEKIENSIAKIKNNEYRRP